MLVKHRSTPGVQLHFTSVATITACVSPDKLVAYDTEGVVVVVAVDTGTSCLPAHEPGGSGVSLSPLLRWPAHGAGSQVWLAF